MTSPPRKENLPVRTLPATLVSRRPGEGHSWRRRLRPAGVALCLLASAGCGERYSGRVAGNSVPFFEHQQQLERQLGAWWSGGGLTFRPPKSMTLVPAPVGTTPALPAPLPGDLLGTQAVFTGPVSVYAGEGAERKQVPMHAVVLSNLPFVVKKSPEMDAAEYDQSLLAQLAGVFGRDPGTFHFQSHVIGGQDFIPQRRFDMAKFVSADDPATTYELYIARSGAVQAGLLFVVPTEPERSERLPERINLTLETVSVAGKTGGGAGGDQTKGGRPSF